MTRKFSVMVAPNGARRIKTDHPALPMTTGEIAATARACFDAGAGTLHMHVRDAKGKHSLDAVRYKEAIAAVTAAAPRMAIQITTEAGGLFEVPAQYACLQQVQPKAASISIREMAREPKLAENVYAFSHEAKIDVQHILYNIEDVKQLRIWIKSGVISANMTKCIFVLGQYHPKILADPTQLLPFLHETKGMGLDWSICAFGQNELACAREALRLDGNIRIGFENNIQLPDGSLAKSNTQTVALAVQEGLSMGLQLSKP